MDSSQQKNIIAALDIGSSKVTCAVADVDNEGTVRLLGYGKVAAKGIRQGCISNVKDAVECISNAISEAEQTSRQSITTVAVALTGKHLRSLNKIGRRVLQDREVTPNDMKAAQKLATAFDNKDEGANPDDRCVAYSMQGFTVGGDDTMIDDPIGMEGNVLKAYAHLAIGSDSIIQNLIRCIRKTNVMPDHLVLQPWASAESSVTDTERQNGVVLLDIGAGTIDVACYKNGYIEETLVIPVGGDMLTQDISSLFYCTREDAEDIKLHYGHVGHQDQDEKTEIRYHDDIAGDEKIVSVAELEGLLTQRMQEILNYVFKVVFVEKGWQLKAANGVVIVGGVAKMPGFVDLAEDVLHLPVRIGRPKPLGNYLLEPSDSTVIGVLLDNAKRMRRRGVAQKRKERWLVGVLKRFFVGDYA